MSLLRPDKTVSNLSDFFVGRFVERLTLSKAVTKVNKLSNGSQTNLP